MNEYPVMIVDDEEAARDHVSLVLKRFFPEFTVVAEAENGEEGLEILKRQSIDIVITDIRMPVMDGLELSDRLHEQYPGIKILILSGYEDFEYARKAFRSGVSDYLLKPINKDTLRPILESFKQDIQDNRETKELGLLSGLLVGNDTAHALSDTRKFRIALLRYGGLVSRFSHQPRREENRFTEHVWQLYGRDTKEQLLITSTASYTTEDFLTWIGDHIDTGTYHTLIYEESPIGLSELSRKYQDLHRKLDHQIILGKDQQFPSSLQADPPHLSNNPEQCAICYILTNRHHQQLKEYISREISALKEQEVPITVTEQRLQYILKDIRDSRRELYGETETENSMISLEMILSECRDYEELEKEFWHMIAQGMHIKENTTDESDIPVFFKAVCRYVENHITEPLKIDSLSDEFRISSSYLSKLFRKHLDCSFTDFLRDCRIREAKRLLSGFPEMDIQEIAGLCGFDDQFYFSKVFKKTVGSSPTKYRKDL